MSWIVRFPGLYLILGRKLGLKKLAKDFLSFQPVASISPWYRWGDAYLVSLLKTWSILNFIKGFLALLSALSRASDVLLSRSTNLYTQNLVWSDSGHHLKADEIESVKNQVATDN
ncbi:hypothetical protein [Fructobacillus fructosus]|uniref:hypothetical protein n=1 Tax=Fructobacillus fructosus TaxID=1631 RepID=UPI0030C867B3